jgi:hypothetical protein
MDDMSLEARRNEPSTVVVLRTRGVLKDPAPDDL